MSPNSPRGSNQVTYAYDDTNRLTSVTDWNSQATAYSYDDAGRMTTATLPSGITTFTWDIASGLPVVLDDGNQYVYGAGLVSMKQSGNWYYYLADGLGSTMAVVDSSGNSQKSYEYDVYGEVTGGSGSLANEFDFAGQQTDGTGLQYLRARYYDAATGTFLSREPLASFQSWTGAATSYAAGSPARYTDPSGLVLVDGDTGGATFKIDAPNIPLPEGVFWKTTSTRTELGAFTCAAISLVSPQAGSSKTAGTPVSGRSI